MAFDFGNANEAQRSAISTTDGPLLIIAGPGTGKTYTLVKRIVYLITEKDVLPEKILIATLLQKGEYTKEEKLFKKKTDTFSSVYWCLTTAIYLAWSFWTMSWDITWIVWPVAGVLFAALLGVVKMVLKNGSETQHYI
ncbi:UvrD-helicase domain-containing protein [Coprococcus comes]|uniref:UvrD-helicase domain-containing protein n=1 Tax=Coprococcus comes TaxID=410072 RepID=UPI003F8C2189